MPARSARRQCGFPRERGGFDVESEGSPTASLSAGSALRTVVGLAFEAGPLLVSEISIGISTPFRWHQSGSGSAGVIKSKSEGLCGVASAFVTDAPARSGSPDVEGGAALNRC